MSALDRCCARLSLGFSELAFHDAEQAIEEAKTLQDKVAGQKLRRRIVEALGAVPASASRISAKPGTGCAMEDLKDLARSALEGKRFKECEALCTQILSSEDSDSGVVANRCRSRVFQGKFADALLDATRAKELGHPKGVSLEEWVTQERTKKVKMRIVREGDAVIGADHNFSKDSSIRTNDQKIVRLGHGSFKRKRSANETWAPVHFTSLTGVEVNTEFTDFRLVVHGFEICGVVPELKEGLSFDGFVKRRLARDCATVPKLSDFVRIYPSLFHKKTIVSASVISEKNTATFGRCGLVLSVPHDNYLAAAKADMQTPVDDDFYRPFKDLRRSVGHNMLDRLVVKYAINTTLENFLPNRAEDTAGARSRPETNESWFNEVAFTPTQFSQPGADVSIVGLFFRAGPSRKDFIRAMARTEIMSTRKLAEELNLPLIHIIDDNDYSIQVGAAQSDVDGEEEEEAMLKSMIKAMLPRGQRPSAAQMQKVREEVKRSMADPARMSRNVEEAAKLLS